MSRKQRTLAYSIVIISVAAVFVCLVGTYIFEFYQHHFVTKTWSQELDNVTLIERLEPSTNPVGYRVQALVSGWIYATDYLVPPDNARIEYDAAADKPMSVQAVCWKRGYETGCSSFTAHVHYFDREANAFR